jgi:RNA polymerase sigma factor (TIGR02999 family)
MTRQSPGEITQLLHDAGAGNEDAKAELGALVYQQLRGIAFRLVGNQADVHTLHPTALVHEAFVKLVESGTMEKSPNRRYFFASAARAMRQILADHARNKNALKRGGGQQRLELDRVLKYLHEKQIDTLGLTEALEELERRDPRKADVVQMRFFTGLTMNEIAEYLGVSRPTVELDWRAARAFLRLNLQ